MNERSEVNEDPGGVHEGNGGQKREYKHGEPFDKLCVTHQCHDVIGQVPSQVRGHKTREAGESNTRVILVGTAEILGGETKELERDSLTDRKGWTRDGGGTLLTFRI